MGSEGTLAVSVEATVRLVPKPSAVAALVGHFDSVRSAIEAVGAAMACDAAAVELVDRLILDLARASPVHGHRVSLLEGEPGAILWVEFYGDSPEEAAQGMERLHELWKREGQAYAVTLARTPAEQRSFRELRKAGLGLLMSGGVGRERSLAFVEDTAVDPSRLVEYTHRFSCILEEHGLRAGFYGHASAACLHIRPFMDLGHPGEVAKMRSVAEAVLELVLEFGGMNSSEHGGRARSGGVQPPVLRRGVLQRDAGGEGHLRSRLPPESGEEGGSAAHDRSPQRARAAKGAPRSPLTSPSARREASGKPRTGACASGPAGSPRARAGRCVRRSWPPEPKSIPPEGGRTHS